MRETVQDVMNDLGHRLAKITKTKGELAIKLEALDRKREHPFTYSMDHYANDEDDRRNAFAIEAQGMRSKLFRLNEEQLWLENILRKYTDEKQYELFKD